MTTVATCSECGGQVVFNPQMEPVCATCGLIQLAKGEATWTSGKALTHSCPPKRVGGFHAGSSIGFKGGSGLSMAKFLKLRRLQRVQPRKGRAESIVEGERALLRACSQLGLSSPVLWRALHLYRRAVSTSNALLRQNVAKPTLAAACLSIALSSGLQGGVVTSKKIVELFKEMGHRVSFNSVSRAMVYVRKALGLKLTSRKPHSYLPFIVEEALSKRGRVDSVVKASILRRARELLDMVSRREVVGKAPRILAAAAVYAASKIVEVEAGIKKNLITQRVLSQIVGVAEFSIRLHYCRIFKPLVEGAMSWSKQEK